MPWTETASPFLFTEMVSQLVTSPAGQLLNVQYCMCVCHNIDEPPTAFRLLFTVPQIFVLNIQ
jgi:hypothetical protein